MALVEAELVQGKEALVLVRCPLCKGLRGVTKRNAAKAGPCGPCRRGNVVPRTQFHNYWLERYSLEEIKEMGRAIWG